MCSSSPDEEVEEEDGAADDPGSATLLMLRPGQGEPIVHVTFMMHDGLKQESSFSLKSKL